MSTGKVLWFDRAKGYGFISSEGGNDVFVHYSAISADVLSKLKSGVEVSFDIKRGEKGLSASEVSLLV